MNPKERARLVDALGSAIADGGQSLGQVPQILRKLLEEDAWKDFETQMGKHITYTRFEDFVTTPPLAGLGTTVDLIKDIVSKDIEAQKLLAKALRHPRGTNRFTIDSTVGAIYQKKDNDEPNQLALPEEKQEKKQERYGQRILRLEKKAPELYAQVLAGEKTVYAAAIEAEIDHPTMTVTLDSPKSAASLIAKASPVFIEELKRLLNDIKEAL